MDEAVELQGVLIANDSARSLHSASLAPGSHSLQEDRHSLFPEPSEEEQSLLSKQVDDALDALEQLSEQQAAAVLANCGYHLDKSAAAETALKKLTTTLAKYPRSVEQHSVLKAKGVTWERPLP